MNWVAILFWILALIHFVPAVSGIMSSQLTRLYGISPDDATHMVLLQHRALLLGLVGAAFACAAHIEAVRWPVLIGGSISMLGFIVICVLRGQLNGPLQINGPLQKIAIIDAAAFPAVLIIALLMMKK